MIRRLATRAGRARAGFTLAFLTVLASAPMVDAAIEALTFDQVAHVESQTEESCYAGHDEVMCQLCRLIDVPGHGIARPKFGIAARAHHRDTRPPTAPLPTSTHLASHPTRGPPLG